MHQTPPQDEAINNTLAKIITCGAWRDIVSPEVREYLAKLLFACLVAISCSALIWLDDKYHSLHIRYAVSVMYAIVVVFALTWLTRTLGQTQFYADMKWPFLLDAGFSLVVFISFECQTPVTDLLYNTAMPHIDREGNILFGIAVVRLFWCFRDANGAFVRMAPLSALPGTWRELRQHKFSFRAFMAGIATSVVVGALTFAVFAIVAPLTHKDAYLPAIFILAAGAFPCGVGIARALIKKELEKRAIAQAEKAAQAKAAAMALAREHEAQKRAEAEQVAEAAKAELGRVQELFQGFALRNMRLETDVTNAAHAAKLVDRQLARTRAANRWALARLHRTNHALAEAECQLAALREEALQLHTALQKQGEHVKAWGLETMRPSAKITAEEVRAVIAALDPDSPTYSHGIKAAAKVLVLLQTAPKAEKIMNNKAILHHFKTELAEFMRQAGILNQYGEPNGTLMANAIHVAMARPGNRDDR